LAILFEYTDAGDFGSIGDNTVRVTGGTSGTPADFADFVTADRAGTGTTILDAGAPASDLALDTPVKPVEDLAILVKCIVANKSVHADHIFITGKDWRGAAQTESIDVSAGDGTYEPAKYWSEITTLDCSDNAAGGGTVWADGDLTVTQDVWGVIWDYGNDVFKTDCFWEVGDGGTSTYFQDSWVTWIIHTAQFTTATGQNAQRIKAGATFILGTLGNAINKTTKYGCHIIVPAGAHYSTFTADSGSTCYLYSSTFMGVNPHAFLLKLDDGVTGRVWNCSFDGQFHMGRVRDSDIYNVMCNATDYGVRRPYSDATVDRVFCQNITWPIYFHSTSKGSISNLWARNSVSGEIRLYGLTDTWCEVINADLDQWRVQFNSCTNTLLYRKHTVNIHVADKNGANLSGVSVLCEDVDGNTTGGFAAQTTAADGTITEQTIIRGYCDENNTDLDTDLTKDYSPHKFTFSKAGYETLVLDNITVDGKINWHLELQDPKRKRYLWALEE